MRNGAGSHNFNFEMTLIPLGKCQGIRARVPRSTGARVSQRAYALTTQWVALVALVGVAVSGAEATTRNVTAYRITPRNYTGLDNMNSGDAAGQSMCRIS